MAGSCGDGGLAGVGLNRRLRSDGRFESLPAPTQHTGSSKSRPLWLRQAVAGELRSARVGQGRHSLRDLEGRGERRDPPSYVNRGVLKVVREWRPSDRNRLDVLGTCPRPWG